MQARGRLGADSLRALALASERRGRGARSGGQTAAASRAPTRAREQMGRPTMASSASGRDPQRGERGCSAGQVRGGIPIERDRSRLGRRTGDPDRKAASAWQMGRGAAISQAWQMGRPRLGNREQARESVEHPRSRGRSIAGAAIQGALDASPRGRPSPCLGAWDRLLLVFFFDCNRSDWI
jgi:hypothetical protein